MGQMPAWETRGHTQQSCGQESGESFRPLSVFAVSTNMISEIINHLNEWWSTLGKSALTIFIDHIKKDAVLQRDSHQVALLIGELLPHPTGQPKVFPLIYSDSKACVSNVHTHQPY